ncbi:MAG: site-2 protease family protein [Oscillospiraceae bacterium]|nr:site-2 protease family protein [Oscillospiraceae bacterium]
MFILISILIFGLIIAVHEFGHFIAAKAFRVGVPEFAIGMGPKLLKKQGKETLYSLRAVPIGGFCALDGDDNEIQGDKSLFTKPIWKRIIIFASGSVMNIAAGFLILLLVAGALPVLSTTTLSGLADGLPLAGEQGFMVGDQFHSIDGVRVYQRPNIDMLLEMRTGDTVDIVVIRDGQRVELNDLPLQRQIFYDAEGNPSAPRFGFYFERIDNPTFGDRLGHTWNQTRDLMRQIPLMFRMFTSGQAGMEDVSSVVGIVDIMHQVGTTAETARDATLSLAMLAAFISISVAMMNLLPIPGLDGGRIFLMLVTAAIAKITRKEVPQKVENYINTAGLALLFGFMIYIIFNDIIQIAAR